MICVADAFVMVAGTPSIVTASSVAVALKPDPLIVTVPPGVIGEGATELIDTELGTVVKEKESGARLPTVTVNVFCPAVVPVLNFVAARP